MKKRLLCICCMLSFLFALYGCQIEDHPIDISSLVASTGTNSEELLFSVPMFSYTWDTPEYFGSISETPAVTPVPRGVLIGSNHGIKCYEPSSGTITFACGDPLCEHDYLSNCAFSDYLMWYQYPVSDGQSLYFIHRPIDLDTHERKIFQLLKCDQFGLNQTVLYETENLIDAFYLVNRSLYFREYAGEQGALLYRYDLDTGSCVSPALNDGEGLLHTAFLPVGESIYYVYDGNLYKADQALSFSEMVMEDCPLGFLYTDGVSLFYISEYTQIYRLDLTEYQTELVYEAPEGLAIDCPQIEDGGISFRLQDMKSESVSSTDYEGWIARYPQNSIFFYCFEEHVCKEIPLGELHVISYAIYDGNVYAQEYFRAGDGAGRNGDWYVMDLKEGLPRLFLKDRN